MRTSSLLVISTLLFCFSAKAQNSISFKTGIKSNPEGFVKPDAYLFLGDYTSIENTNSIIPQFDFGLTLKKPESNWALDLGLNYQYTQVNTNVYYEGQSSTGGYSQPPFDLDYITSLNYLGVNAGTAFFIPFKHSSSQLSIPFGVQLMLPFSCKSYRELSPDEYTSAPIYQGEDYSDGIYYGAYLRPTYSFQLSKNRHSKWRFGLFAEAELLFANQAGRDPNFLVGGGIEIRYLLN